MASNFLMQLKANKSTNKLNSIYHTIPTLHDSETHFGENVEKKMLVTPKQISTSALHLFCRIENVFNLRGREREREQLYNNYHNHFRNYQTILTQLCS